MTTKSETPTEYETIGRTFVDAAWNDGESDQLERVCSPTLVVHDPAEPAVGTGPDAYARFVSRVTAPLPWILRGGNETMERMFGDAYQRLVETKTAYDRENRFRVNQPVQPLAGEGSP